MTYVAPYHAMLRALYQAAEPLAAAMPGVWKQRAVVELIPPALAQAGTPEGFLAWAGDHPAWRLTLAECATQICAKPAEAAIYVIGEILEELIDEGGELL